MPWWPIMMASVAVGAPKIWGTPPAARMPSMALRASRSRWALHGVMSLNSEATPIIGRLKSSSRKPTARSMARFGARPMPAVVSELRRFSSCDMIVSSALSRGGIIGASGGLGVDLFDRAQVAGHENALSTVQKNGFSKTSVIMAQSAGSTSIRKLRFVSYQAGVVAMFPKLLAVIAAFFLFFECACPDDLKPGAAAVDITPPTGYAMGGSAARHDTPSVGVLDPLR